MEFGAQGIYNLLPIPVGCQASSLSTSNAMFGIKLPDQKLDILLIIATGLLTHPRGQRYDIPEIWLS